MALVVLSTLAGGTAWAQTPTPTPNGQFLCSAGPEDGQPCNGDYDCTPTGVCVIAQGVCNGGSADGAYCDCAAGSCIASTPACSASFTGICQGGVNDTQCCDTASNCTDGAPCVATQKVCLGGDSKASSCVSDGQCPGSTCGATGKFCSGGDFDSFACVDDADCPGSPAGSCLSAGQPTPTPPPTPSGCVGDCDASGDVTINELITMVNIVLGTTPLSACPVGDADSSGDITINEIIIAVNNVLVGCGPTTPTPTPAPTGEFLCSAGPRDGEACNSDDDCAPTGVCVIAQGVCDGGPDDTLYCGCIFGTCSPSTPACDATITGVCVGGANATECCSETSDPNSGFVANCSGGSPCTGTARVCAGGENKGVSCLGDAVCVGSVCQATGRFCNGGDFDGYACVDANDCLNVDGSSVGTCDAAAGAAVAPLSAVNACMLTNECPA